MTNNRNKNPSPAKTIDLHIYGPIVDAAGWFVDENEVTTPGKIRAALADAGNVDQINVHINSPGGSVFAGQAIHNMLQQHPANVTVYVDGLAASIASIIAMCGNKIVMPPGAMMMIHNPLVSIWGTYEAADMREMAGFLDKVKESLVATYCGRCSKTKDEVTDIMDATTWLTAEDAVNHGFADEVMGTALASSLDGSVLNIAGKTFDLSAFSNLPLNVTSKPAVKPEIKEEKTLDLQELKDQYPDLYKEALNLGVSQERARMQALDEVAMPGFEKIVNKARYETGENAANVAMQIIASQKQQGGQYLKDVQDDAQNGNLNDVPAAPAPDAAAKDSEEIKAAAALMAEAANVGRV